MENSVIYSAVLQASNAYRSDLSSRMQRESMPIWAAYSSVTGAFTASQSLGGIGPAPGQAWYIDSIVVTSTVALDIQLSIGASGITPSGVVPPTFRFMTSPGAPTVIPLQRFVNEKFSISATNTSAAGTGTDLFKMGMTGYAVANDFAFEAKNVLMMVGDSISNGTGVTYGEQMYHWQLRDWLIGQGRDFRMIQKGRGGWDSTHAETARAMQMYNVEKADIILYNLGMNDSAVTAYQNTNLPAFVAWKQKRMPKAKLIVLGPSPRQGALEASVLVPIRAAASSIVSAAADPKIFYCNLGASFSNADDTYYYTADGTSAGSRVHPNTLGHTAMYNTLQTFCAANGI